MKKTLILMALAAAGNAFAGGLLTNTNQNAAFLRNMAQDGTITPTSIYANPAGGAFLSPGWHLSINSQTAIQERNISTTFPLFQLNKDNPSQTHEFKGDAQAPIIPSVTLSYNRDKWSLSAHFGLVGGGGKCEFYDGLGSFEALYSGSLYRQIPGLVNAQLPGIVASGLAANGIPEPLASALASPGNATYGSRLTGYGLDSYMRGRSYYFGLQVGGTYKFLAGLAGYVGLRGVYATCNYLGYVQDVVARYAYQYSVPADAASGFPGTDGGGTGEGSLSGNMLSLNCDQTGFGVTPIVGIDWEINKHWNVAAKYECPTVMKLRNKSQMNNFAKSQAADPENVLSQFEDGKRVREDIPGILTLGVQYSPVSEVRLSGGFHEYFDKAAEKYGGKQNDISHNTCEFNFGAEYDVCRLITVSASWQTTQYGMSDNYMNDLSFNLSNHMIGGGVRIHPSKYFNIDLGYMHTFYGSRDVVTPTSIGDKTDHYVRKNDVVGIGFNLYM